jgi:hypothetical protein
LENLTQATVVERMIRYISLDPMKDRDVIKRGGELARATKYDERDSKLVFRNMFIDNRDEDIALVAWNLLTAVAQKWHTAWNTGESGQILNRTTGFAALMRILPDIYLDLHAVGTVPTVEAFASYFVKVSLTDKDFNKEVFIPGSGGETRLYHAFASSMGLDK